MKKKKDHRSRQPRRNGASALPGAGRRGSPGRPQPEQQRQKHHRDPLVGESLGHPQQVPRLLSQLYRDLLVRCASTMATTTRIGWAKHIAHATTNCNDSARQWPQPHCIPRKEYQLVVTSLPRVFTTHSWKTCTPEPVSQPFPQQQLAFG